MTAAHTPGPWRHRKHNGEHIIDSTTQYGMPVYVATLITVAPEQGDNEANARLIAAAPELLATLQEMVDITEDECRLDHHGYCQAHYLDDTNNGGCRVANAKAAIIKATGQAK
jgi:hypothetical protein